MNLLKVDSLEEARAKLLAADCIRPRVEAIALQDALKRILSENIYSPCAVPAFRRSTVDGYAVVAKDTQGTGEGLPVFLQVNEEVEMAHAPRRAISSGQCAYVPTGGMLPEGADACVMIEYSERFGPEQVALYEAVASGRYVVQAGEDVQAGQLLLEMGRVLGPKELALLAGVGLTAVSVWKPLSISLYSTGDELAAPGSLLAAGQVYDINTSGLAALAQKHGFELRRQLLLPDQPERLRAALAEGMRDSDIIVVSGGSSKGKKDYTAALMAELADSGLLTHGLALKPGKPTILAADLRSQTLLLGLPGHPVAAMMIFELLAVWLQRSLTGAKAPRPVRARAAANIPGAAGRLSCQLVRLEEQGEHLLAHALYAKSGLISSLAEAEGYILIDRFAEGISAGQSVEVHLL